MLINGITAPPNSGGEHCLFADTPDVVGSELSVKSCSEAVKGGTGGEIFRFMDNHAIYTLMGKRCLSLQDGNTQNGTVDLADCDKVGRLHDGRAEWEPTANSQLKCGVSGNWCLTMNGTGIKEANAALGANASASSTEPTNTHTAANAIDGKDITYWASSPKTSGEPVNFDIDYSN